MKHLVIVESPSKSKTIEKYLGSEYKVVSSKGHIRDLTTSGKYGFGVDVDNDFTPHYEPIKGKKAKVNWNKMSLKEKAIAYGEDVYDDYKKDLGNKIQQREEIFQELYSERDDFQYMFDKAKTWKDVVDLSKKVLAPNTKIVMHELYRSSKELNNLKEQSANADKSIAKTNVVDKKGAVIQ